ncbi:MAG TPA: hypothetical protein VGM63_00220 [Mucilaginibacter sp.]|jgi:hypothetical protein
MKHQQQRLCIYPKDISKITGRTVRSSYDLLDRIKKMLHKKQHQAVTVDEFCDYIGIRREDVPGELLN